MEMEQQQRQDDAAKDVQVIRDVLSVQHVPVVASLHWEKLCTLLHSLCDSIATQALRLEKAEEQGRNFATVKDELDKVCRNALKEVKECKESEQEQQKNWSKLMEDRMASLQKEQEASLTRSTQFNDTVNLLQNVDLALLQSLPQRLETMEEAAKKLSTFTVSMLDEGTAQGIGRNLAEKELNSQSGRTEKIGDKMATGGIEMEENAAYELASQKNSAHEMESQKNKHAQSSSEKFEALHLDSAEQNERIHNLESQYEELKTLTRQTTRAQAYDLEALQKYCRALRSDFEMSPLLDLDVKSGENATEGGQPVLEGAIAELQNRLQRKADADTVNQLLHSSQSMQDIILRMGATVDDIKSDMRKNSSTSNLTEKALAVPFSTIVNQETQNAQGKYRGNAEGEILEGRVKKLERDLIMVETQLSGKADRQNLEDLHFKLTLLGNVEPCVRNESSKEIFSNHIIEDDAPTRKFDESILQTLKEMISRKADRDEVIQLRGVLQPQPLPVDLKELREDLDGVIGSVQALAERSDLAVLLSKRFEQVAEPVATLSSTGSAKDEIQAVINEHALRIMEYADMLLQMETLLASKADASGLLALKASIQNLQQNRKSRAAAVQLPTTSTDYSVKKASLAGESAIATTHEAVQNHEKMILQLFKDLESLGKIVHIMSGHDKHLDVAVEQPQNISGIAGPDKHLNPAVEHTQNMSAIAGPPTEDVLLSHAEKGARRVKSYGPDSELFSANADQIMLNTDLISTVKGSFEREPFLSASLAGPAALSTTALPMIEEPEPDEVQNLAVKNDSRAELPTSADFQDLHDTGLRESTDIQVELAKPPSDSSLVEVLTKDVAVPQQLEYQDLFRSFEDALKENKIQPKEDATTLLQCVQDLGLIGLKLKEVHSIIATLQDDVEMKADKIDLQKILRFVQTHLDRPESDRAMFTGKPLLGFRCMSCDQPIERLNPTRADYLPTNIMPKQLLPMLSAERIFASDKKEMPPNSDSSPVTPEGESMRVTPDSDTPTDNQLKELISVGQQLSPNSATMPRYASSASQITKPKAARKMQTVP
ncbi:hypothetical protein O6H91_18G074300 [Diphasiastrum complanatum]|uniref:Uncharacterized protein n=1 Tax=Diphasiastrum complanatum TaxID=34168 RepID=A0ACC2B2L9_DIPCM|nr:hypothetical protein O6H91_18G074300 [Diphasiastrum complanatum]